MMRSAVALLCIAVLLAGCAGNPSPREKLAATAPMAIVASPYEPAAQFPESSGGINGGAVVGAAGGAAVGAVSAQASAGLLCTIGGPLCLIVMIPAAIVGGLVGGVTGGVIDAVTADPGNRIANARSTIEQAVAELRLTDQMAAQIHRRNSGAVLVKETDYRALAAKGIASALEVEVTELQFLPREKEMALSLRARARLYRTADGALIDERVAEAQTDFRKYQDWAADEARPLRVAMDEAVAKLGRSLVNEPGVPRRADISARPDG
jgi:hypothetical protein